MTDSLSRESPMGNGRSAVPREFLGENKDLLWVSTFLMYFKKLNSQLLCILFERMSAQMKMFDGILMYSYMKKTPLYGCFFTKTFSTKIWERIATRSGRFPIFR